MANTILTPSIIAKEALMTLENNLVMGSLVHRGYSNEFKKKGDTISIRKHATFESKEFDGVAIEIQDATQGSVDVQLQHHLDVSFEVTSKELSLDITEFGKELIQPALQAHSQKIDELLLARVADIPYKVGTAGTTPSTIADIAVLKKACADNKMPVLGRNLVIDSTAESELIQLDQFINAEKVGDNGTALREGSLGRKLGFDIFMDQNVGILNQAGAGTVLIDNGAGYSIGDTALHFDGVTTALVAGDLVSIGGSDYICTSVGALSVNDQDVVIYPPLKTAVADDDPVTLTDSHVGNVAFHRGAFALASANLEPPMGGADSSFINYNGLALRATFDYDSTSKKNIVSIDGLFGTKTLQEELAVRLLG